jgi:diguanylate cyclase (GGDEF)-like protein/PAS domain S-box-containing protein
MSGLIGFPGSIEPEAAPADHHVAGAVADGSGGPAASQQLAASGFHDAPTGIALVGLDGRWLKVNASACRILGWSEPELLRRTIADISHPDDRHRDAAKIDLLISGRIARYQSERRCRRASGAQVRIAFSVSVARDAGGAPRHFVMAIEDLHHPAALGRAAESGAAPAQHDHANTIISAMHDGYALTIDGEIRAVNDAMCTLTGFSSRELIGSRPPYPFWPPELHEDHEQLRAAVGSMDGGSFEVTMMHADGTRFDAEVTAAPARDTAGNAIGFVSTMRDVSDRKRHQRELERLARTDSLTGLANRRVLDEALRRQSGRRAGDHLSTALVLLDIDRFKQVNDGYGHPVGDSVLVEVARRLELAVRGGEVLARIGGEEFAWLLPAAGEAEAIAAADRARAAIAARPFVGAGPLTVSAGVGVMSEPSEPGELYLLADRALYDAKQCGRDRTCARTGPAQLAAA